ncbi:YggS family pyridoxal phosphate enzyme [Betaproteobacteria bacterium]|nr:YggS family pyridoxal phosphate enzyme [Betaproteobacteria bacterium]GHU39863.1 YggS family pyridoxal phosphate enzyme [Betaproteobacteria bacterium]
MSAIATNLQVVQHRIITERAKSGRQTGVISLLAVSKTRPAADVLAALQAGQQDFGENYVQEGVDKMLALRALSPDTTPIWHFIGPLQSNKTRLVAEHFAWAHTIERLKIAERLSAQRPEHLPPLQVCVQVNVSGEASKSGCSPAETYELCRKVAALPRLQLRGLMCIPAPACDFAAQCRPFAALRQIFVDLQDRGLAVDTLSMGMSDDLEAAICEGSTLVRVGAAIFGARKKS